MKIYFNLTDSFLKEQLLKGIELKKEQSLEFDFSQISIESREIILTHCAFFSNENSLVAGIFGKKGFETPSRFASKIFYNGNRDAVELWAIDIEGIVECLKTFEADRQQLLLNEKEAVEKVLADFISSGKMLWGNGLHPDYSGAFNLDDIGKIYHEKTTNYGNLSVSFSEITERIIALWEERNNHFAKIEQEKAEKNAKTKAREEKIREAREKLLDWAKQNGSELLKLRIKHNQNWQTMANVEWAMANTKGFSEWEYDKEEDQWNVNNATINQLKQMEKAVAENPYMEVEMIRCKFMSDDQDHDSEYYHRTFLRMIVDAPVGQVNLYKEISDDDI